MRKTINICGKALSVKLMVAVILVCSLLLTGVVIALVSIGVIQIGYEITPVTTEVAPTFTPSPLSLDLGSILSGSSGTKEFSKVATLTLPSSWEITFTLDLDTVGDFSDITVHVYLYKPGETYYSYSFYFYDTTYWNYDSSTVDAGTYDVTVTIDYTAETVTTATSGTAQIDISYPG